MKTIRKYLLVIFLLLLSTYQIVESKQNEKTQNKKLKYSKIGKNPKPILDLFPGLNPEDELFIKELDKQFSTHGDNLKIKIQKENITESKNSKRTVDSDLGYAYDQNYQQGYQFSNPHYVRNNQGYSNLGKRYTSPVYHEIATDIEIQKSTGYEIKPTEHYIAPQQEYQPVIVLKIPGPSKYAQHLQALLQQYLEIRAAQYIRAFEEQERLQTSYIQPHMTYSHPTVIFGSQYVAHTGPIKYQYHQPSYQTLYHAQSPKQETYYHQYYDNESTQKEAYQPEEHSQSQLEYEETQNSDTESSHQEHPHSSPSLKTIENYPSDKHTQVIFKEDKIPLTNSHDIQYVYEEPSHSESDTGSQDVVEITQRTPYTHYSQLEKSSKRHAPYTVEEFKKYNQIIQKLKKQHSVHVIDKVF